MPATFSRSIASLVCLAALCHAPAARAQLPITWLSGVTLPNGGEIVSTAGGRLLVTNSGTVGGVVHQALSYTLSASGSLTPAATADLSTVFTTGTAIASISSVLADGRGFGVAAVIPVASGSTNFGRIAFFNTATGSILKTLDVGYHPDSVAITPDGTKILVANEGEVASTAAEASFARPGSVSVIDISGVTSGNYESTLGGLSAANVATYDFSAGNLAAGVTLTGLRNNRSQSPGQFATTATDIEPEYIAATNAKAYVTLQENNAVAVLDFTTGKYEAIHGLGSITKLIDASDREDSSSQGAIGINDSIRGLPMPDTMVRFSVGGTGYLITANEGDARADWPGFNEETRVRTHCDKGLDPAVFPDAANLILDSNLGRLRITANPNGGSAGKNAAGQCNELYSFGARSFSIWDTSFKRVYDSGDEFERRTQSLTQAAFNASHDNNTMDSRSPSKGPEPEGVVVGKFGRKSIAFIGLERVGGVMAYDVTDPAKPVFLTYFNSRSGTTGDRGAEGLILIPANRSPNGKPLLVIGNEVSGTTAIVQIDLVP